MESGRNGLEASGRGWLARAAAAGVVATLAAPAFLAAVQEGGTGETIFSINIGLVIWTWVLFLLTLGILAWKVFPAIAGGLEERRKKIQDAIDQAQRDRDEAAKLREEQRRELEEARREAQRIVERSREAADSVREELVAEARREQEQMLERTREEMAREREQLREEIRREAVDVAIAAAERLLRERLDRDDDRRLVEEYMARIS